MERIVRKFLYKVFDALFQLYVIVKFGTKDVALSEFSVFDVKLFNWVMRLGYKKLW